MREKALYRSFVGTATLVLLVVLAPARARAQAPVGSEFLVNAYTTGAQGRMAVAGRPDGTFLIVWQSVAQDGDQSAIFGRLFDVTGTALTGEFQINATTTGNQRAPSAAVLGTGDFVVVWDSVGQDGSGSGVFGRRIVVGGPSSAEFRANTYTTGDQKDPHVAASDDGFVVVWDGAAQDGASDGIFGQCFTAAGTPVGSEFGVNSYTPGGQFAPLAAMNASGSFVVAWSDYPRGQTYAQLYASDCARVGGEFTAHPGFEPAVGMDASGRFAVAATVAGADGPPSGGTDNSTYGITVQRYDASGVADGPPQQVNSYTTGVQEFAHMAMDPDGQFVISWDTFDGTTLGASRISARTFQASGAPAHAEFQANTNTTIWGLERTSAVASNTQGQFVVAWQGTDGDGAGVKAQGFLGTDMIFADGFDSGAWDAWSGAVTGPGNLAVAPDCGLTPTPYCLQATVTDTSSLYALDNSPSDEAHYRARFYFSPADFDPGVSQGHLRTRIFIGFDDVTPTKTRRLFAIILKRDANGAYSVEGRVRQDDNSQTDTGFVDITDAPHHVEIDWKRSSGPDALDGAFQMWIDGTSIASFTNLDDSIGSVDFARLGALSVKGGATGTLLFDQFESRRKNPIGPYVP